MPHPLLPARVQVALLVCLCDDRAFASLLFSPVLSSPLGFFSLFASGALFFPVISRFFFHLVL